MGDPFEIRPRRTRQLSKMNGVGDIVPIYEYSFYVGDQGPFYLEFTQAEFMPENIKKAVEAIAATVRGVH